ncbi:MAG: hypothetical protein CSB34_04465 [Desulfobulbus propionicus]|nr:MAG: hypothetical protein CSB34_04465 [Desulfobulbus propionicus]
MAIQTERITILGTPDFKAFLTREAKKEGISMSELVRQRCAQKTTSEDEKVLAALVEEVRKATVQAQNALNKGLKDAEQALEEMRSLQ